MDFRFRTNKLAKICSTSRAMVKRYGPDGAQRLAARLQELEAAATLADMRMLPQARAHELTGDRDEQISVDLDHPRRLILTVANDPTPRTNEGGLDWDRITAVVVEEITDTHQ